MVWDNAVLVSRKTAGNWVWCNQHPAADDGGLRSGVGRAHDQRRRSGRSRAWRITRSASRWVTDASEVGRVGVGTGFDAYPLRTHHDGYIAAGATVRKTGETYPIACTQNHWSMEGRAIVREANLEQFKAHPDFADSDEAPAAGSRSIREPHVSRTRSTKRRRPRCISGACRLI